MRKRIGLAVTLAVMFLVSPAFGEDREPAERAEACGRADSIEAAKAALSQGDRAAAVDLLRQVEARLDRCAPRPAREGAKPESERAQSALALEVRTLAISIG